jgi:hypothetical protein
MEPEQENQIKQLVAEKLGGRSYTEIRKDLATSGMSSEEISRLIREVDKRVLEAATSIASADRERKWYRAGLVLAVAGLLVSVAFNAGLILREIPAMVVYAPFLAGILIMLYGRLLQRRKPVNKNPGPGPTI